LHGFCNQKFTTIINGRHYEIFCSRLIIFSMCHSFYYSCNYTCFYMSFFYQSNICTWSCNKKVEPMLSRFSVKPPFLFIKSWSLILICWMLSLPIVVDFDVIENSLLCFSNTLKFLMMNHLCFYRVKEGLWTLSSTSLDLSGTLINMGVLLRF